MLGYTSNRRMVAMSCTKCIVDINVTKLCQRPRKGNLILSFFGMETHILQQKYLAWTKFLRRP